MLQTDVFTMSNCVENTKLRAIVRVGYSGNGAAGCTRAEHCLICRFGLVMVTRYIDQRIVTVRHTRS